MAQHEKMYYVPAKLNPSGLETLRDGNPTFYPTRLTVGYLVQSTTREAARIKLQARIDERREPFTALKRVRVATDNDLKLFEDYKHAVIK